jgi:VanZ family protein
MTERWGRLAFAVMVAVSLVVLFTPASGVPSGIQLNDKVIHGTLFAALAVTGRLAGIRWLPLALALVVYAGASEVLQSTLPLNRDGDARDALADATGVLVGLGVVALLRANRRVGA